ncbi:zinc finger protein 596 [Anoplophora glabripennis]|uniref:zinc finger protein 596 n=1 Tax=Anoplophora glabripennis TaxID=217634 RepID=UPI000874A564|nr:zinc finger protein 596 [Anoplophora glabripennis]
MNSNPATCLICLKNNYNETNLVLVDVFTQEWNNVTYLNKLQSVLSAEITVFEETLICSACVDELNKAYEFKERVVSALDYWSTKFEETVTFSSKDNGQEVIDIKDNNEINELSSYTEDIVTAVEQDVEVKNESLEIKDQGAGNDLDFSNFPCRKCKAVFFTASELVNHVCDNKRTSVPDKKVGKRKKQKQGTYKCNFCDLHFSKVWKLTKHFEIHDSDKKFVCNICNHAFKQSYHLREHITTHTGERNFTCEVCGKKFQRLSSQKRHMRTHNAAPGEKSKKTPFLCNICGKSFPYSNGAQRHMRIHTGDKRYRCDVCNRTFNQSTHLKVHLRTHTGERPYMCNICGDTFSLKASLHKHMNGHNEAKNDVKIFQNLEPNLSRTKCEDDDEEKKDFIIDDLPLYDQGFLITCSQ